RVCPVGAINWGKGEYALIDKDKCTKCKACTESCPAGAIE
ncbi:MAG: 4Fe-4S binding protein, partial [Caldisericota bacterium]|nr:4Fe-4S binding protein [Caldisericota bacterium]